MGRDRRKKGHDTTRDAGQFVALPCVVLDCPAYMGLSHPAKSLLLEIARQYNRDNNGRLLASRAHLLDRGWTSNDTITRALKELQAAKLIHQTVMGHRPNKASWYAVTWRTLDRHPGYDHGAVESFVRGAYKNTPLKNDGATPPDGDHLDIPSTGARQRAHAHHDDCVNHAPDHGHERHAHMQPVHLLTYTPAPFAVLTIDSG